MPLMTYYLTRMTIEKSRGPVSTRDIISFVKENLPVCTDDIVFHLRELDSAGILEKELSREKKGFIWKLRDDLPPVVMKELHPGIYENSKFFRSIYETVLENNSTFSGSDLSHLDMLLGLVGKATARMKHKPGLDRMAGMVGELVDGVDFSEENEDVEDFSEENEGGGD